MVGNPRQRGFRLPKQQSIPACFGPLHAAVALDVNSSPLERQKLIDQANQNILFVFIS